MAVTWKKVITNNSAEALGSDPISISGTTLTLNKGDGSTDTVTLPDNNTTYSAGTGMSLSGTTFNCSITDTNTTYSAGSNMSLSGTTFSSSYVNTTYSAGSNMALSGTTFSSTDTNTTYTAGTGMSLSGTTFNCDITDTNTTYSAGSNMALSGTTFSSTDTNTTYTAGTNMSLSGTEFSSTDTNTTYSAGSNMSLSGTTFSATNTNVTTNLAITGSTGARTITSSDGTDAVIPVASALASGVMSQTEFNKLNGIETSATADQTASEILTAIKTVDGSGSGLDADTLDTRGSDYFSADGHTHDVEDLDHFEEGSWTPTLNSGWSHSGGSTNNRYTKIGPFVHLWGHIDNFSGSSGTADVAITGLPFTVKHSAVGGDAMFKMVNWNTKSGNVSCYVNTSEILYFFETSPGYDWSKVSTADLSSGTTDDIYFSIQYETDED